MDERLERHLCNLRNEVFEAAESRINTECSLIICEGVSPPVSFPRRLWQFPHYMLGYIGVYKLEDCGKTVPSLYVRVYLTKPGRLYVSRSSLIICEGISFHMLKATLLEMFPHYM